MIPRAWRSEGNFQKVVLCFHKGSGEPSGIRQSAFLYWPILPASSSIFIKKQTKKQTPRTLKLRQETPQRHTLNINSTLVHQGLSQCQLLKEKPARMFPSLIPLPMDCMLQNSKMSIRVKTVRSAWDWQLILKDTAESTVSRVLLSCLTLLCAEGTGLLTVKRDPDFSSH